MMRNGFILIVFLITIPFVGYSQQALIDSLLKVEQSLPVKQDTTHIKLLCKLSSMYESINLDSSLYYGKEALKLAEKINYKNGIAGAHTCIGYYYNSKGNYEVSLEHFIIAKKIHEANNNYYSLCEANNSIGNCLIGYGKTNKALTAFLDGYELAKTHNFIDKQGVLAIGIGNCYLELNDPKKALEYFSIAKEIFVKKKVPYLISFADVCIASALGGLERYEESFKSYESAIAVLEQLDNQYGIASAYQDLAKTHQKIKNYDKAIFYNLKAQEIFLKRKSYDNLKALSLSLSECYLAKKDYKNAYKYQLDYSTYNDSILNDNVNNKILEFEAKYENEKKEKEIKIKNLLISEKDAKLNEEALHSKFLYLITGIIILLSIILSIGYFVIRKNNTKLSVVNQNLELKNNIIEEKSKEITHSITYAKRIQNAILPADKVIKQYLKESFVYYQPKDIVAGDFYWLEQKNDTILFAVADCTGHGVPGAMVSVICNNALNRAVREYGLTNPGKILDKTREIVIKEFEKSEEEVKDGMDIALCSLTFKVQDLKLENETTAMLQYAGAHNPLWIITNCQSELVEDSNNSGVSILRQAQDDTPTLLEIKADKQPIGQFDNPEPYTTHTIELQKGDTIYIFSDGYADQFGGKKGKKLKKANFKKLLLSLKNESMDKQKELINTAFEDWKGDLEQLDDVCLIGVRI